MEPTAGVRLRPFTDGDAEAVARIYGHYVEHSLATFDLDVPEPGFWRAKVADLAEAGWPFLVAVDAVAVDAVAVDAVAVVGFAYVAPFRAKPAYRRTVEDTVYLAPGHTGRGIGRALLTELLRRAKDAGATQVIAVISDAGDDGSARLHAALGFQQVGRLRAVGFKHGRWIDTVYLQAPLG